MLRSGPGLASSCKPRATVAYTVPGISRKSPLDETLPTIPERIDDDVSARWELLDRCGPLGFAVGRSEGIGAGRRPVVRALWQCICEGASGLVFFSWFNLQRNPDVPFAQQWDGLKQIAAEIDRMAPVLLSIEPTPPLVAGGAASGQPAPRWLRWTARMHAGKLWIVAVNDGDGEGAVSFVLPSPPRGIAVADEGRTIRAEGKRFCDSLRPLAVHIYEITL